MSDPNAAERDAARAAYEDKRARAIIDGITGAVVEDIEPVHTFAMVHFEFGEMEPAQGRRLMHMMDSSGIDATLDGMTLVDVSDGRIDKLIGWLQAAGIKGAVSKHE